MTSLETSTVSQSSQACSNQDVDAGRKATLRRTLISHRQEMPEFDRTLATSRIAAMLRQRAQEESWRCVAVYLPWRGEPDLRSLWQEWQQAGLSLALPVVVGSSQALEMRHWTGGADFASDLMGLPVPATGSPLTCDTWIIPCVGVGPTGERLGAGKGFYDRSIAGLRAAEPTGVLRPRFIGICFGRGEIAEPFAEPHDQRLDACLTERGWRWL
jgi:5-formyltetrahydrofolate cyclo-ligase